VLTSSSAVGSGNSICLIQSEDKKINQQSGSAGGGGERGKGGGGWGL